MAKKVIVIAGPTAVGKTAFAIGLAKHFNCSIISADSRQCYKEMCIGVATPTEAELAQVPHFFIQSHSVNDVVNACVFEQYALEKAKALFQQNDTIIIVGGTGLYIKAFCEGMDAIPPIPIEIRNEWQQQYELHGLHWLQKEVQKLDDEFWQQAEQQNPQRLLRALEVKQATGNSLLSYQQGITVKRPFEIVKIGLELPREQLYQRINNRVLSMIDNGLINEVQNLTKYQGLNALQTVGYKEFFAYLAGQLSIKATIEAIQKNTRHYAKRQMTWFKKDLAFIWLPPSDIEAAIQIIS